MRETIIVAPGANGTELTKCLALHGINTFNINICNGGELARMACLRSGIALTEKFINRQEECAVIVGALDEESYFQQVSYSDIQEIADAVRRMRSLVIDKDESASVEEIMSQGIFTEKNTALVSVYKKYCRIIRQEKLMDSVSVMKKAIASCKPLNADIYYLTEFPLSPVEGELVRVLSDGNAQESSIQEFFRLEKKDIHIDALWNCYGASNEVEMILNDIYKNKKLDQSLIVLADRADYVQLLYDYALLYDIPMTFGCGIPIINSNPAKLLKVYHHWITGGFFGKDAFMALISSKAFDKSAWKEEFPEVGEGFSWKRFYEVASSLRLSNNSSINEKRIEDYRKSLSEDEDQAYLPFLEIAARELALYPEVFIRKYALIRKGSASHKEKLLMNLDMAAAGAIYEELSIARRSGISQKDDELIANIMKMHICRGKSEAGYLHITDINGGFTGIRKHMYVAGLSSSKFPGNPSENYLLLDADLELFGDGAGEYMSDGRIRRKRTRLFQLISLAASLKSSVVLSYSGLNVSELKKDNASSIIFELLKEEQGRNIRVSELEKKVQKIEYFEPAISRSREVGKAYNAGKTIKSGQKPKSDLQKVSVAMDRSWSPSAINKYLGCPRSFLLAYLLGIPEPEETDPFEIISAKDNGTLAHTLMEELANSDLDMNAFLDMAGKYFDDFILQNPPLIPDQLEEVRSQFLEMMETAYEFDPHREVILKEEDIQCLHETGVKLHGLPDRVEKLPDGTHLIVDFKSGQSIRHEQDDIYSCLQVVIYAYLMEAAGYNMAGGEFRYIRLGETVTCKYDAGMKQALHDLLRQFQEALEKFEFPMAQQDDTNDPCKFCNYKSICKR